MLGFGIERVNLIFAMVASDSLHEISTSDTPAAVYDAWTTETGLPPWRTNEVHVSGGIGEIDILLFEKRRAAFHFRIDEQIRGSGARRTGMPAEKMP
jgi:hypothetical protein